MTCGGSVSNHLWCSRYKDCIHLLTALRSGRGTDNYLTVRGQQGLCSPLLLLCQRRECAFQLRLRRRREENEADSDSSWKPGKYRRVISEQRPSQKTFIVDEAWMKRYTEA